MREDLVQALESRIESLGYELVELETAGHAKRPILRVRIDRPGSEPGSGVTVEDCTKVSRSLESLLDEDATVPERYVLEVSSPGVERPLVKRGDFERFAGSPAVLVGRSSLAGRAKRLEGELVGIVGEDADERVVLRLADGDTVEVPRSELKKAHLRFEFGGERKRK